MVFYTLRAHIVRKWVQAAGQGQTRKRKVNKSDSFLCGHLWQTWKYLRICYCSYNWIIWDNLLLVLNSIELWSTEQIRDNRFSCSSLNLLKIMCSPMKVGPAFTWYGESMKLQIQRKDMVPPFRKQNWEFRHVCALITASTVRDGQ